MNPETKQIRDLSVHQRSLRFKCRRCAIFCCRLGGPKLTRKDVERIKQAGYHAKDFLEQKLNSEFKGIQIMEDSLKNREDGSCVFLKLNAKKNRYECSIYDFRPALCRLYPFDFDWAGPNSIVLKFIPCCRGLNLPDGNLVDREFIINHLLGPLLEAMKFL
jgi:Fe-S-cluster containining protein